MTPRDWDLFEDMLEHAQDAVGIAGGISANSLVSDRRTFLAICHAIQIVGEAANGVSPEGRAALSAFAWEDAIRMRQVLVHHYGRVEPETLLATVHNDLPPLIVGLELLLKDAPE